MHPEIPSDTPGPAVYDAATIADLADLFGRARLQQLLAGLDTEIARRRVGIEIAARGGDWKRLGEDAHALVSASGSLGFTALSDACARLEQACLTGGTDASSVAAVLSDAAAAQRAIAALHDAP